MEKKVTRKEVFVALKVYFEQTEVAEVAGVEVESVIEHLDASIKQLDKKADKAKERAGKAKAEGDALRIEIASHLTGEYQTIDEIAELVVGEDVTKAKIVARLTQLVNAEVAVKESVKRDNRKIMGYALAGADKVQESTDEPVCLLEESEDEE